MTTARALLALLGTGRQDGGIDVADLAAAGRVRGAIRGLREKRGERPVGRKIGFSNARLWPVYGVDRPMWNYVWDTTLHAAGAGPLPLAGFAEPRIEPEIVLELAAAPEPGMDEAALLGCVGRVAHGFELVHSVFPGWRFTVAQCTAAFGLHGALLCGPWQDIAARSGDWGRWLSDFSVTLSVNGRAIETGHASNVLGGPLRALKHLVDAIGADPGAPRLAAGELVSTGTLTDALPVRPGDLCETAVEGIPLPGLRLAFA
ncbi:MAG TPA: fumarylacetoacetate hydrolase family protein [Paracoccaceae bacterium]|nr:fumarylacetoacetate hydrolase family protein [Paracoccaceae bacterium]HMO71464.1 fumarylacetoacetate hydrolase family protein [Paracoccaceae bacterium]